MPHSRREFCSLTRDCSCSGVWGPDCWVPGKFPGLWWLIFPWVFSERVISVHHWRNSYETRTTCQVPFCLVQKICSFHLVGSWGGDPLTSVVETSKSRPREAAQIMNGKARLGPWTAWLQSPTYGHVFCNNLLLPHTVNTICCVGGCVSSR